MNKFSDVTVIIPAFNCSNTLRRAIESISSQSLLPKHVIVVNDASIDNTSIVLRTLQNENLPFNLFVLSNIENLGPGLSRNLGWDLATTKWIAFLDADDAWHPRKLELQIKTVSENPTLDLICTQTYFMKANSSVPIIENKSKIVKIGMNGMLFRNIVPTRSVLMRREITQRFRDGLSEDYGLWLECLHSGLRFAKIQLPLAFHFRAEFGTGGLSSRLLNHEYYELKNLIRYALKKPIWILFALLFSIVKFIKRVLTVLLRKAIN
jgi:glycosyltransferase involved in cell wall biosynthesis